MNVPKLTDVITEGALKIFLHGFYRKTGLSVSLYVDPGMDPSKDQPVHNKEDAHPFCIEMQNPDRSDSCMKRNAELAKRVLVSDDKDALGDLRQCPHKLRHWAEVIRNKQDNLPIAVMCFGGVLTDKNRLREYPESCRDTLYMEPDTFEERKRKFKQYTEDIEEYYNAHVKIMDYAEDKTVLTAYRSISGEFPSFIELIHSDLDKTFDNILDFIKTWTGSKLNALCILDQKEPLDDSSNDIFVVRRVTGIDDLEKSTGKKLYGPEIFPLKESFLEQSIKDKKPFYVEEVDPKTIKWGEAVRCLNTRKALALPLILEPQNKPLGALICFPEREIWKPELDMFGKFAKKIAVTVHLATRNELYERSQKFSEKLLSVASETGDSFYKEMAGLIKETLTAEAASIFILDRSTGYLKLVGTTDTSQKAKEKIGQNIYELGEGITGKIATQTNKRPYGEIIHDLYADERRSNNFEEKVDPTRSGKHSLIAVQILSPNKEVLGVVRCVDVEKKPQGVFNCFNHFYLEGLQFWAGIVGIIITMKERIQLNHEFILKFVHEFRSSLCGLNGDIALVKSYLDRLDRSSAHLKIQDAMLIAEVMSGTLEDIELCSFLETDKILDVKPMSEKWIWLEKDLLMPVKNCFQNLALNERGIGICYDSIAVQLNVDKKQMMQVLINLIRNAIKYSYDQKDKSTFVSSLNDIAILAQLDEYGGLCVDFINQGIGINEDEKENIFELYKKGRNAATQSVGGLGIGLFICRKIMQLHGGEISVKSCSNPTIIRIRFPSFRVKRPDRRRN